VLELVLGVGGWYWGCLVWDFVGDVVLIDDEGKKICDDKGWVEK
jgi:hypothetical protein